MAQQLLRSEGCTVQVVHRGAARAVARRMDGRADRGVDRRVGRRMDAEPASWSTAVSRPTLKTPKHVLHLAIPLRLGFCVQVVATEGVCALTIGLAPTLLRNCIWNSIYYVSVVLSRGG